MAKTKRLLSLAVAGSAVWGAWHLGHGLFGDDASAQGTEWLVNHMWVERLPSNERDMVGHLALIEHPGTRIGIAGRSSQWRLFFELFKWGLEGDRLSLYFPQEEVKGQVAVKTWRCKGEAPAPFELCLEVSSGRRKATYYSREDWVLDGRDPEASVRALAKTSPELAGVFERAIPEAPLSTAEIDGESFAPIDWMPPGA